MYKFALFRTIQFHPRVCGAQNIVEQTMYFAGGGAGCHLRVVPPGQLHRRPSTPKRFCLSAVFIEPGLSIFCVMKFLSHVFFVFAFWWFRVFHRGCCIYFPIVFSSNSLYIHICVFFIYFFIVQWVL